MLELLFLLLPVAAGYGWIMGRNSVRQAQRKQSSILSKHYYKGLNFLLSDQPDKAVDTLIKMINVNSDTVETHIAMGSFFRHRGEIDRAIKVHQNLVSRDELQPAQRENALRELGHDYTQEGFIESAENAFLQLLNSDKHYLVAQQQLFSIYQTTKEWERAIELAERMVQCHGDNDDLCERLAHFYCEQASVELKNDSQGAALTLLQKAVNADEHAVRPWLMLGDIALDQKRFTDANAYFTQVAERDINWFSEAVHCLEKIAEEGSGMLLYLRQEGRGIGLTNKIRAYSLQDQGMDTVQANEHLGFGADERDFKVASDALDILGVSKIRLMTNNPRKVSSMKDAGIDVVERVPLKFGQNPHNAMYLSTKQSKLGHLF